MSRLTRKSVFRSAVVLILLGILMVLVTLTNPSAMLMATATLLIGVVMTRSRLSPTCDVRVRSDRNKRAIVLKWLRRWRARGTLVGIWSTRALCRSKCVPGRWMNSLNCAGLDPLNASSRPVKPPLMPGMEVRNV